MISNLVVLMAEFFTANTEEEDDFFGSPIRPVARPENRDVGISRRATTSAATGRPVSDLKADEEAGIPTEPEALTEAHRASTDLKVNVANKGMTGEQLSQEELDELRGTSLLGNLVTPDIEALTAKNQFGARNRRVLNRVVAFDRVASGFFPEDQSFGSKVGSFADVIGTSILTDIPGLVAGEDSETFTATPNVMRRMAQDLAGLLFNPDISDEEFMTEAKSILDVANDSGLFTEENPIFIQDLISMASELGVGEFTKRAVEGQVFSAALEATPVGFGPDIVRLVNKGGRAAASKAPAEFVEKVAGKEAAVDVGTQTARVEPESEVAVTSMTPSGMTPGRKTNFSGPNADILQQIEAESKALQVVEEQFRGLGVDPELLSVRIAETTGEIQERLRNIRGSIINIGEAQDIGLDNLVVPTMIGRRGGKPFLALKSGEAPKAAQDMATRVGGRLEEVAFEGKKAFVVVTETNVPLRDLNNPLDINEFGGQISEILSTTSRISEELNFGLKTAESTTARTLDKLSKTFSKAKRKAGAKVVKEVDDIYEDILTGQITLPRNEPITDQKFAQLYAQKHGRVPDQKTKDYFKAFSDLSDSEYFVRADAEFKKAVDNGEVMVRPSSEGAFMRAKRVSPEDSVSNKIWDDAQRKYVDKETAFKGGTVYRVHPDAGLVDDDGLAVRFIVEKTPAERRLFHTDVLAYNVGAHRVYNQAQTGGGYFIRQGKVLKTIDGEEEAGSAITFMRVETAKQAARVVEQFNKIVDNINTAKIDDIIKENNEWNVNIQTKADFEAFAKAHGLDIERPIARDADGEQISDAFSKRTVNDDFVNTTLKNRSRGVQPLIGMGGDPLEVMRASEAIPTRMMGSVMSVGYQNWVKKMTEQLFEAAKRGDGTTTAIKNINEVQDIWNRGNRRAAINAIEFSNTPQKTQFEQARRTLNTALGAETMDVRALRAGRQKLLESVLDENTPLARLPILKELEALGLRTFEIEKTANFLRRFAFDLKLGLFAPAQLWVQSSMIFSSAAITVGGKLGLTESLRTVSSFPAIRLALASGDNTIKRGISRLTASAMKMTPEEFDEMLEVIERSGRLVLEGTAMEENVGFNFAKKRGQYLDRVQFRAQY